jgi:murein DD-endopeptidase MepM/ murein hydrolase activator NlpD
MLIAPAGPTLFEWFPNVKGYGNIASFAFTHRGELYRLFYAHCSESLVAHGTKVSVGQQVARSGCSGDTATSERCGLQLAGGGRTDHVHVGLAKGAITPVNILDPATFLKWDIRMP